MRTRVEIVVDIQNGRPHLWVNTTLVKEYSKHTYHNGKPKEDALMIAEVLRELDHEVHVDLPHPDHR